MSPGEAVKDATQFKRFQKQLAPINRLKVLQDVPLDRRHSSRSGTIRLTTRIHNKKFHIDKKTDCKLSFAVS